MTRERISEAFAYPANFVDVYGSKLHYVEAGEGNPILFLHGIPTSAYLWRNVIPHISTLGRCIAPDLVGFGKSDKPDITYSIMDHIKYIERFIEVLDLKNITLVMHGWGSIIGFDYAMRHENNCRGLVFYEAFLRSLSNLKEAVSLPLQEQLLELQEEENSADLITTGASFIDKIIPQHVMRTLTEKEMDYYRQPFLQAGTSKPIVEYLKELSSEHEAGKVDEVIERYSQALTHSSLPKLMLYSVPGFITTIATIIWAKEHLPHLEIIDMGEELHLAQESYPKLMGETISVWMQGVEQQLS